MFALNLPAGRAQRPGAGRRLPANSESAHAGVKRCCGARSRPAHGKSGSPGQPVIARAPIHSAMATIITFSVSDTKPSGTFDPPPTQAHFSSRLSI